MTPWMYKKEVLCSYINSFCNSLEFYGYVESPMNREELYQLIDFGLFQYVESKDTLCQSMNDFQFYRFQDGEQLQQDVTELKKQTEFLLEQNSFHVTVRMWQCVSLFIRYVLVLIIYVVDHQLWESNPDFVWSVLHLTLDVLYWMKYFSFVCS